ncbi:hypothetical protein AVEN_51967-1, partial [Araneus ventricosus]
PMQGCEENSLPRWDLVSRLEMELETAVWGERRAYGGIFMTLNLVVLDQTLEHL